MKQRLIICGAFSLILLLLTIIDTYGLFETNAQSTTEFEIGKWEILLNGEDVTLDRDLTIDDFVYTTDSHTEDGYLSPGGEATMDLEINYEEVSTALTYEISIDKSALDDFPNMSLKVYDLDTNTEITDETITGSCMLSDTNKTKELRIKLIWENDEDYDENDINVLDRNISFFIHMHFSQMTEE